MQEEYFHLLKHGIYALIIKLEIEGKKIPLTYCK